jgi:hypothetical protein
MFQQNQNDQNKKLNDWLSTKFDKVEIILAFAFLLILLLESAGDLPLGSFKVMILSTLAMLYFFNAYMPVQDKLAGPIELFVHKLVSISLSVSVIGIFFRMMNWPGLAMMQILGPALLVVSFVVISYLQSKKPELTVFTKRLKIRVFIIAIIGLIVFLTPTEKLIEIGIMKERKIELSE